MNIKMRHRCLLKMSAESYFPRHFIIVSLVSPSCNCRRCEYFMPPCPWRIDGFVEQGESLSPNPGDIPWRCRGKDRVTEQPPQTLFLFRALHKWCLWLQAALTSEEERNCQLLHLKTFNLIPCWNTNSWTQQSAFLKWDKVVQKNTCIHVFNEHDAVILSLC